MTVPISPVSTIDPALQSSRKTVDQTLPTDGSAPSMEQLTQRFQTLMAQPGNHVDAPQGRNAVGTLLDNEQQALQQMDEKSKLLTDQMPGMSAAELLGATSAIQRAGMAAQFKMTAVTTLATSSNKSLQSLLKNS